MTSFLMPRSYTYPYISLHIRICPYISPLKVPLSLSLQHSRPGGDDAAWEFIGGILKGPALEAGVAFKGYIGLYRGYIGLCGDNG